MADFSPGDVVVIRDWDDMEQEFGLNGNGSIDCMCHFVEDMRDLCGRRFTIKEVDNRGIVLFVEDDPDANPFNFSTDMIRHDSPEYIPKEIPEVSVPDFLSLIS